MKSIRLSLIMYFLVLLAAALGAVSWLAYASSTEMVQKGVDSKRRLLEAQYHERVEKAGAAQDKHLLESARTLARLTCWSHEHFEGLYPVAGIMAATMAPQTHLFTPLWLVEGTWPSSAFISKITPRHITLENPEAVDVEYYQVSKLDGRPLERSDSLAEQFLPPPERGREVDPFTNARVEDVTLVSGKRLRMVTIKTQVWRPLPTNLPEPAPPRRGGFKGPNPTPPDRSADRRFNQRPRRGGFDFAGPPPWVYVQVAATPRQATVLGYRADLDKSLDEVASEANLTLAALRTQLLWISSSAFIALAAGGFWLVRLGLLPLARLSEAVSRVSARDFRLQVEDRGLPGELQPIVARLKQTLEQLRRAFDREKQAAADISHELRTPLAALLTTLDVGLRKTRSAEEYRELLLECRAAGQQMTHLVERLLALARLDAGVDHLRPREVDAAQVAEECAALVRPLADAREVSLKVLQKGPAPVRTDPDKLREILTNLLHNAIQYNRPQGTIEVAVERHNGKVDVEVQDTGIGIAPDAKEQIFERFYRADQSRHADDLHAGLGLAIVKGYVDLMGGTIAVDSTLGQGSTFRVRLPAGL